MRRLIPLLLATTILVSGTSSVAAPSLATIASEPIRPASSVDAPPAAIANRAYAGTVRMTSTSSNTCLPGESGIRKQVFTVKFTEPFKNANYVVGLGVRGIDVSNGENLRIDSFVENKANNFMTLVAQTWCTTSIYNAHIDYMAVGE